MELQRYEEMAQNLSESNSIAVSSDAIHTRCLQNDYSTPTPNKISRPPRNQLISVSSTRYTPLAELFDRIVTSARLLTMRKKLPTFQNIRTVIKVLTQRILSYSDLAQIKYMLPEALNIEKILIHDKKTLCMVPDMKITFLLDGIGFDSNQSAFITLRQIFHQRLLDFFNDHPESSEIPVAMLPEPFNQRIQTDLPRHNFEIPPSESAPLECELPSVAQSTRKHFSQKIERPEMDKTLLLASPVPPFSVNFADKVELSTAVLPQKECSLVSNSANTVSPAVLLSSPQCSNAITTESPLVKVPMLPHPLIVQTPVQPTPAKRFSELSSCEKIDSETRVIGYTAAKRSLNFESEQYNDCSLGTAVTKSIHADGEVTVAPSFNLEAEENDNHNRSQTGLVNYKQAPAFSIGLMNTVETIFRSANGPLITKEELLQKIIAIDLDILDIGEAEEKLKLLEEVAPDWIFGKIVPSGDLLYGIKKISDLESVRARLSAAA